MQTIVVQGESVSDVNLVIELAKKLNLKIKVFSLQDAKEVIGTTISDQWDDLSQVQKEGILEAIKQIEDKRGIPNNEIIAKYRSRYHDA